MPLQSTPGRFEQLTTATPGQQQLQSNVLSQALQALQASGQQPGFTPIAQQARRQFAQQTVPTLAERFTSMGQGSLSSPAFASQLGQAGAGLDTNLAALRSQYQQNQQSQQQSLLNLLLNLAMQPQFQYAYQPGQTGAARQFFSSFASGLGQALPMLATGGMGGAAGAGAGLLGNALSGLSSNRPQQVQNVPSVNQQMQNALFPLNQFGGF